MTRWPGSSRTEQSSGDRCRVALTMPQLKPSYPGFDMWLMMVALTYLIPKCSSSWRQSAHFLSLFRHVLLDNAELEFGCRAPPDGGTACGLRDYCRRSVPLLYELYTTGYCRREGCGSRIRDWSIGFSVYITLSLGLYVIGWGAASGRAGI